MQCWIFSRESPDRGFSLSSCIVQVAPRMIQKFYMVTCSTLPPCKWGSHQRSRGGVSQVNPMRSMATFLIALPRLRRMTTDAARRFPGNGLWREIQRVDGSALLLVHDGRLYRSGRDFHVQRREHFDSRVRQVIALLPGDFIRVGHRANVPSTSAAKRHVFRFSTVGVSHKGTWLPRRVGEHTVCTTNPSLTVTLTITLPVTRAARRWEGTPAGQLPEGSGRLELLHSELFGRERRLPSGQRSIDRRYEVYFAF